MYEIFDSPKIFIGKSEALEFPDGKVYPYTGNSILAELPDKPGHYVYIGMKIREFSTIAKRKIVKYVSNMGNNGVPYPFAIDEKGSYYLMEEDVTIKTLEDAAKKYKKDQVWREYKFDPYRWFYINRPKGWKSSGLDNENDEAYVIQPEPKGSAPAILRALGVKTLRMKTIVERQEG